MAVKWQKSRYPGVRFYEHESRKHGVQPDRYWSIRHKHKGVLREEGLGWSSQGWGEKRAVAELAKIKEAQRTGQGPQSLSEQRQASDAKRKTEEAAKAAKEREKQTFGEVFHEHYMPNQRQNKGKESCDKEEGFFRNWMTGILDDLPLKDISGFTLERLKKKMQDAGKSPKTINYCLGTVRQVFNFATRHGLYQGTNPVSLVKKPKADNRRMRFLSKTEADMLLDALAERSTELRDIAMLSLHCGLRAGEIFSLRWGDVDLERNMLMLTDTKNGETRAAFLTEATREMLECRERGAKDELVFPDRRNGRQRREISNVFQEVADKLFNEGVEDRRFRVVFHTLRHSFASLLVENGVPIFAVKELLGHKTLAMATRYSHMAPDTLRKSVSVLNEALKAGREGEAKIVSLHKHP